MKILIADDEIISRKLLSVALTKLGHEVVAAEDGAEAWSLLDRDDAPRLAILDWNMPGLDGPEICRRLRKRTAAHYTYVILVTGRSGAGNVVVGLEAGADDFISKPLDPGELRARVRAAERLVDLQAENERSRSYLSSVLANIDSGVILTDAFGRIVFMNSVIGRMAGFTVEEGLGQPRDAFLAPLRASIDSDSLKYADPKELPPGHSRFDVVMLRPERRILRCSAIPVELPEGRGRLDLYYDITQDADRERETERLARTDMLTGLLNRRGVEESLAREFARRRRNGQPLAVVLFDIDHFKKVNDTHGHGVGDEVIRAIGRTIAAAARNIDIVARWGGEELLAVLPDTDRAGGLIFGERVRAAIAAIADPGLPSVTISAGVAEVLADETSATAATGRADARLYEAKASGRNTVR